MLNFIFRESKTQYSGTGMNLKLFRTPHYWFYSSSKIKYQSWVLDTREWLTAIIIPNTSNVASEDGDDRYQDDSMKYWARNNTSKICCDRDDAIVTWKRLIGSYLATPNTVANITTNMAFFAGASNVMILGGIFINYEGKYTVNDDSKSTYRQYHCQFEPQFWNRFNLFSVCHLILV